MTIINLECRIRKIEVQSYREDPALKAMSDDKLVHALRRVSDDPADHAFSDWFQAGCEGPLPASALAALHRSL